MKKEHLQTQAQPNQTQQAQQQAQKGGEAMIYFVTFPSKVDSETAKQVLAELRKRFPAPAIFTPRPPKGKKLVMDIKGIPVIVTFPYTLKNPNTQEQNPQSPMQGGFTLGELIKSKKT